MAKSVVLLIVGLVRDDFLPAARLETTGQDIVALISVKLAVAGGVSSARNKVEDALLGGSNIPGLPALGEVIIPVLRVGLKELLV